MISGVCTLFEGDFHLGVGALVNSLYAHGYRGTIYAGYRGSLPPWISAARDFDGFTEFTPADGLVLRFIPLTTTIHLTNYKPDFMLTLWEKQCPEADAIFYFDPDITIKCRWSFFEEWIRAGVGICEDVNPQLSSNHPIRFAWKRFLTEHGIRVKRELDAYYNGGFVGLARSHIEFLETWKQILGYLSSGSNYLSKLTMRDRTLPFCVPDQDALNIAAMVCNEPLSPVGQDGMDFHQGGYIMTHSVGALKPWRKKMLVSTLLKAIPPSRADKGFIQYATHPIRLYSPAVFALKLLDLTCASAIGRYVR
jgi:hypothetical protein